MPLAAGLQATQLGRNVRLNGGAAAAVSFASERPLAEVIRDQAALWRSLGFHAAGEVPGRKGIALAFHPHSGEKYSLVGVELPRGIAPSLDAARRSQGLIVYAAGGWRNGEEAGGALPGFPLMPGGRGGAVVSAQDPGGRTQTASYTNPGGVRESIEFYREALAREGWREVDGFSGAKRGTAFGSLTVRRERQEATLLFSSEGSTEQLGGKERTTAIVIVGQRGMFSGGV